MWIVFGILFPAGVLGGFYLGVRFAEQFERKKKPQARTFAESVKGTEFEGMVPECPEFVIPNPEEFERNLREHGHAGFKLIRNKKLG